MADKTHIEWTEATWSPITGCKVLSPGCKHCYAMKLAGTRLRNHPSRAGLTEETKAGPVWNGKISFNEQWLDQPSRWTRPRKIFVCAHADLFYEEILFYQIDAVFREIIRAPQHEYQILTKRPSTAERYIDLRRIRPMPNVLIGTSVEDQIRANERRGPLAVIASNGWRTWVSYEPALGPVYWDGWDFIEWMVSGGESGVGARPSHPDWHREARDFCVEHGIPYFFKQWGSWGLTDNTGVAEWALAKDGTLYRMSDLAYPDGPRYGEAIRAGHDRSQLHTVYHVGKKAAGAMLDGREWRQYPKLERAA